MISVTSPYDSVHPVEHSLPPGFVEKVQGYMSVECQPVAQIGSEILICRGFERPVDEQRSADDVLFRDASEIAAVVAHVAVVAHHEVVAVGDDNVLALHER